MSVNGDEIRYSQQEVEIVFFLSETFSFLAITLQPAINKEVSHRSLLNEQFLIHDTVLLLLVIGMNINRATAES